MISYAVSTSFERGIFSIGLFFRENRTTNERECEEWGRYAFMRFANGWIWQKWIMPRKARIVAPGALPAMFLGTPKAWDEHYRNRCQTQAKPAGGESFIKKGGKNRDRKSV